MTRSAASVRWLLLMVSLPPSPSRHRVRVWRKLRALGAVALKPSVYLLPATPATTEQFQWLSQEIQSCGGSATLVHVEGIESHPDAKLIAMFQAARRAAYAPVIAACREVLGRLDRGGRADGAAPEPLEARLRRLRQELDRLAAIDYFEAPEGREAQRLWEACRRRLDTRARPAERAAGAPRQATPRGARWVTRERPHVDRVASAWCIKRFIDPDATFGFVREGQIPPGAIAFDMVGAPYGHEGEDCTLETLVRRFRLRDPRLRQIAEIVHDADLEDGKFGRLEAAGLELAVRSLLAVAKDDAEVLARGMDLFDGIYTALGERR